MKILITGGAGYKGLKLAEALLECGHRVTIFDNFMYGCEPCLFLFRHPAVSFLRKDLRNTEVADLNGFDCVYHLAAISGYPACEANPHSAEMINVAGTRKLLAGLGRDQLLVYASTTSIYGASGESCAEDADIAPASLYAKTKYEAELLCMQRPNSISLRFATLFGVAPRMRWDLMPNEFVMRAVQERTLVLFASHSVRTFLHIDDAVRAYVMVLDNADAMIGRVFNVGTPELNLSKLDLANAIGRQVEFTTIDSDLDDPDVRDFRICFDRIRALGFRPLRSLDQGIAELVKLFEFYRPVQSFRTI